MINDIEFVNDVAVKLIRSMASDDTVIQAAQVSGKGENSPDTVPPRLIQSLMKNKHGVPFEHNAFTFFIELPIFASREQVKHRISSINEMSGRYTTLLPRFYIPGDDRSLVNNGTKMKPDFGATPEDVRIDTEESLRYISSASWNEYQRLLGIGVANEVARMVLPVNIMSQMYWTVNARSLMNYLSLRSQQDGALVPSFPQREIQMVAEKVEDIFAEEMPLTHEAFVLNGRVAP
jgi:thymidylate synthase (FAD)